MATALDRLGDYEHSPYVAVTRMAIDAAGGQVALTGERHYRLGTARYLKSLRRQARSCDSA